MGQTLDMAKIREDHQARTNRLIQASAHHMATADHYTDDVMVQCYADMLTELATIWREEANRLSELPSPKPRGWKTTMESLRDCATRVSGVAVAMRNHGLPGDESGPKALDTTAGASTPESVTREWAALHVIHPLQDGKSELQKDLRKVHDGHMTVNQFREKHGDAPIPEDQMVEFLKHRKDPLTIQGAPGVGPELEIDSDGVGHPKASTGTASHLPSTTPNMESVDMANGVPSAHDSTASTTDPVAFFLDGLTPKPNVLLDQVHEESLAEAAASIIEQVKQAKATVPADLWSSAAAQDAGFSPDPGPAEVYMNSNGVLDTSTHGEPHLIVQWTDNLDSTPVATFTIGAADAPPAWASQPMVPVFELDSPMEFEAPAHTSVSQANQVAECALKRKLAKRHGAPERPSWALVGGKAFHECVRQLEGLAQETGTDLLLWAQPTNVSRLWEQCFERAQSETINENPLFPKATWHASNKGKEDEAWWNADGPEMVHHYLAWRAKWTADGWELLRTATGQPVVELEFLAFIGGGPVKGVIDSAWYHKERDMIAIVDWKSGTSKPADYFQQATYRHALAPLLDAYYMTSTWTGAFWDARKGELGPVVDLDVRHPRAEVELRLSAPRKLDAMGLYMPNVNTGYGGCGSCSLKRSCPVGSRIGTGEVTL